MIILILLFLTVVISSALCSMSEAAILSLPLIRARILSDQNKRYAKDLLYLKENLSYTVSTIVILNNSINIVGSIFIGQRITFLFGHYWLGLASAVLTFVIIVAAEIIPKTIGERYKVRVSLMCASPLKIISQLLNPLVHVLLKITKPFVKAAPAPKVTEDEIRMMLHLARASGTVEMDEEVLCNRVFKLNDVRAIQIMKPLDQIYALPAHKTLGEVKEAIINSRFSRIAVCDQDSLNIVGIVQQRILLREMAKDHYQTKVCDLMMKPIYVNWFIKADALLEMFQAFRQHLFIVQDSQKRNVGLVTMEDVLEELFGEIYDEKDAIRSADILKKPSDGQNNLSLF